MARLFKYIEPYMGMIIFAIILLFGQAACDLALPDFMSDIINDGIAAGSSATIGKIGLKMLGISLLSASSSVLVGYLASRIAAGFSKNLRLNLFKKVESFSNKEFDEFSTSSLITRTTNDITQVQTLVFMMIRLIFYAPIMGIGGFIHALAKSKSMSWIIAVAVISLFGIIALVFITIIPRFKKIQGLIDKLNLVVRENLDGMLVIRAFSTQKFEEKRFDNVNSDLTKTNLFVNRVTSGIMPAMMLIMNLVTITVVWVGSKQISAFKMDVGDMMAYMQYVVQIIMAFLMMSMLLILMPRAEVSANRIADVLDKEPSVRNKESTVENFIPSYGRIEFKNVCFRYPKAEEDVLHNINFSADPGQTTAFIGSTGSGKSTLVNLIPRFYDVTEGEILIDGINILDLKLHDLRKMLGYVPQKGVLFSGTIDSNLKYADKNVGEDKILKAATIAQAMEFINTKQEKFQTPISQGGTNVSGGQKQRLSIARALLKEPKIYIFDDSFSALDFKTDVTLRSALKKETVNSTVLIVAQRISTIINADKIVVLDNGHIVEIGTHESLMKSCDIYREIAMSQFSKEELE